MLENSDRLITEKEAAALLGVSTSWLQKDRCYGYTGLPFVRIGGAIRYRLSEIEAFIELNTVRFPPTKKGGGRR